MMTNLQKSIQREISLFRDAILSDGGSIPEVSAAAFCKARKKLKHTAFLELNQLLIKEYYQQDDFQKWKGLRVLAADGTDFEIPASEEIQKEFGVNRRRHSGKIVCMARSLTVYDALNHITLHAGIDRVTGSEHAMLWDCLPQLSLGRNDLMLFDRNFADTLLFFYLKKHQINFCFRMSTQWLVVKEFISSKKSSAIYTFEIPTKRIEQARALGIAQKKIKCRMVRVTLDNGEVEVLLTNLLDEQKYSNLDIKKLYAHRWSIEESYKTFKHKVCLENFTGKSVEAVLQDFHVKLFIMNLTAVAVNPINKALQKDPVRIKYKHQVNIIEAIASMKKAVVSFFVAKPSLRAIVDLVKKIAKRTVPIRKKRSYPRNLLYKRRQNMNYKPV